MAPKTGAQSIASSGQFFMAPLAVAVAADGGIYVVDALGAVICVDPATGQQALVTSGNLLHRPQGIAVAGTDIYVTDVATADGNFGVGRIVHIDARSGDQMVLSEGDKLVGPVGITLGARHQAGEEQPQRSHFRITRSHAWRSDKSLNEGNDEAPMRELSSPVVLCRNSAPTPAQYQAQDGKSYATPAE